MQNLFSPSVIRVGIRWEVEERAGSTDTARQNAMMLNAWGMYGPPAQLLWQQTYCRSQLCFLRGRELGLSSPQLIIFFNRYHILGFN